MKDNWVLFLQELSIEFAALNPPRKITLAIPWSPAATNCLDGRCYPFKKLAKVVDYMIIMGYDAEEDWWGVNHYGHSTTPYYRLYQGLREYIDCLEIPPYKLSLAVPWYSFKVDCITRQEEPEERSKDRMYQCTRRSLQEDGAIKTDYKYQIASFMDFENRVDAQGNDMSQNAFFNFHYSDVEDSFYFHTKVPDKRPTDVKEHWVTALPGNGTDENS